MTLCVKANNLVFLFRLKPDIFASVSWYKSLMFQFHCVFYTQAASDVERARGIESGRTGSKFQCPHLTGKI